jgi:SAM-dependent methyltransferase
MDRIFATLPKDICDIYKDTRYLPENKCRELFEEAFENIEEPSASVLDVGSGTGRIAIPLAKNFEKLRIIGIDLSQDMVDFAAQRAEIEEVPQGRLSFKREELFTFARSRERAENKFDSVICHWCLHCIRPWRSALLACVSLTDPSGHLFWLDEDSSLYRALDDVEEEKDRWMVDVPKPWRKFWERFHELRSELEPYMRAQNRTGTVIRSFKQMKAFLDDLGWSARPAEEREWEQEWPYKWIIDSCLAPRAFTSLQRLDATEYARKIEQLRGELGQDEMPKAENNVTIKYSATLCEASAASIEKPHTMFDTARKKIDTCADQIYHEVLDLCFLAWSDSDTVIKTIKDVLAIFFSALFNPINLPWWRVFWRNPHDGPQLNQMLFPQWVWIRFAERPAPDLKQFIQNHRLWYYDSKNYFSQKVLEAYFNSRRTLAEFVFSSEKDMWRPICIWIKPDFKQFKVHLWKETVVQIEVPYDFVRGEDAFCPMIPPNPNEFDDRTWAEQCRQNLGVLFPNNPEYIDPYGGHERWRSQLRNLGRELDAILGVNTYTKHPERFVQTLQSCSLFPGTCYYLFPIRDVQGEYISSISFATDYHLQKEQIDVIKGCVDRMLTVASLVAGLVSQLKQTPVVGSA